MKVYIPIKASNVDLLGEITNLSRCSIDSDHTILG